MEIKEILLPFFGFFIGAFGTLAGIGGGVITVPLLILAYSFESRVAVGTSIAVVLLNAVSGTVAYLAQRRVDLKVGIPFSIATVPGAVVGILLVKYISTGTFSFLFGIILMAVGAYLAIAKDRSVKADPGGIRTEAFAPGCGYTVNLSLGVIISLGVGLLAGLFGIGGGVIHVPCMILLLGIPVHISTATSHFVLAVTGSAATVTAVLEHSVNIKYALLLGCGVVVGAQAGARISKVVKGSTLKKLLAVALALLAVRFIIGYLC
jgi:hypothetical protein